MNEHLIQISSGVGPEEARRFVSKLAERFERLCDQRGLLVQDIATHGTEAAPNSVTLHVRGDVLQRLGSEQGSHLLIHRSLERGRAARKRWFAAVTIVEIADNAEEPAQVQDDDLIITACRAGGPGGQHVNKVSTAVRVEHAPSGLSVRVATERSQKANVRAAVQRLAEILQAQTQSRRATAAKAHRQLHYRVVRGNAVRTYRLAPDDTLVEDATLLEEAQR